MSGSWPSTVQTLRVAAPEDPLDLVLPKAPFAYEAYGRLALQGERPGSRRAPFARRAPATRWNPQRRSRGSALQHLPGKESVAVTWATPSPWMARRPALLWLEKHPHPVTSPPPPACSIPATTADRVAPLVWMRLSPSSASDGSTLVYGTFLGGSTSNDWAEDVAVDGRLARPP